MAGMTVKSDESEEKVLYSGQRREPSRSRYGRRNEVEKKTCARCDRCTCSGRTPKGQEGRGAERGESRSKSVECYNCGRGGHYARECRFQREEGNLVVAGKEKTPEDVPSEEEWDALATVAITNVMNVEEAVEPKEEEFDFEPWLFEEPVVEETEVVSCAMAEEEPQERAKEGIITEEGDDNEKRSSAAVVEKTARLLRLRDYADSQEIRRDIKEARRWRLETQYEKLTSTEKYRDDRLKILKKTSRRSYDKKRDDPDGRGIPKTKKTLSRC